MFGTPKVKKLYSIIKGFRGCPKKVRKTGGIRNEKTVIVDGIEQPDNLSCIFALKIRLLM